jgi:hypothetical protein
VNLAAGNAPLAEVLASACAGALSWLGGWFLAFLWYQRRLMFLEHRQAVAMRSYLNDLEAAEHEAREVVRLTSLYEQLRDWAEIIAWTIHRPEGPTVAHPAALTRSDEPPPGPIAMRCAWVEPSTDMVAQAAARLAKNVLAPGWLSGLYAQLAQRSMHALKLAGGANRADPNPDPDRVLSHPSPRGRLLRDLEAGRFAGEWLAEVRGQAAALVDATALDELFERIEDVAPDRFTFEILPRGAASSRSEWFTTSLWTPPARVAGAGRVKETMIWGPRSWAVPSDAISEGVSWQSNCLLHGTETTIGVIRVDISDPHGYDELALFDAADRAASRSLSGLVAAEVSDVLGEVG